MPSRPRLARHPTDATLATTIPTRAISYTFSFDFTTNLTSAFTGPSREGASDDVVHGRLPTGSPDGLDRDVLDDLDKLTKACLEADRAGD